MRSMSDAGLDPAGMPLGGTDPEAAANPQQFYPLMRELGVVDQGKFFTHLCCHWLAQSKEMGIKREQRSRCSASSLVKQFNTIAVFASSPFVFAKP